VRVVHRGHGRVLLVGHDLDRDAPRAALGHALFDTLANELGRLALLAPAKVAISRTMTSSNECAARRPYSR